jgi:predicted dehydrogenase
MSEVRQSGMTRREFAKVTAAAGAAVLAARQGKAQTKSDTLKVGLLGCGGRGTGATMQMLEGNENVLLVAMADLFQDRLDSSRKSIATHEDERIRSKCAVDDDHCFVGLDAYKRILATDIDIVIEGTLPYSRPRHVEAAVEAEKHIFAEKPAAVDPVGVRQVMAAANKARELGLSFVAGTQRRHDKAYQETIDKIHNGAVGEIVALRAYWCGSLPFVRDREEGWSDLEHRVRNWYNYCWLSGDNIVEQHVHNLDVCNWAMGNHPVSVFASGGRTWKPNEEKYGDLFDHFSCDYEYPGGAHMTSMSRHWYNADSAVFEEVAGTKGRSNCHDMSEGSDVESLVQEHIDLVKSIRGEGPYLNEGVRVAESTLTAIMGRMSAYTGLRVTWEEALNSDLRLVPEDLSFDRAYPVGPVPRPGAPANA